MRKAACPHDLGARVVILGIVAEDERLRHDGAQQAFGDAIRDFHRVALNKVALHGVHENIGAAAGGLIIRQSHGQFGIHDGELRAADIVVIAALDAALLFGDDGGIAHFAAGSGDGQHHADGQTALGLALVIVEIPDVAVHAHAVADGLGRVDDAAAADGKDEVNAFLFAQVDALIDEGEMRVGDDAAKLDMRDVRRVEGRFDLVEQAAAARALTAEMNQNLFAALRADEVADLLMGIFAEIDVGRGVIAEIAHEEKTSSSVCYALISEMEKTNGREKGRRLWRTTILESVTVTAS